MCSDLHLLDTPQHPLRGLCKEAQSPDMLDCIVALAEGEPTLENKTNKLIFTVIIAVNSKHSLCGMQPKIMKLALYLCIVKQ